MPIDKTPGDEVARDELDTSTLDTTTPDLDTTTVADDAKSSRVEDSIDSMLEDEEKADARARDEAGRFVAGDKVVKEAPVVVAPKRAPAARSQYTYQPDGSVVDQTGQIVARAGAERRHWERANQAAQRAERAEQAHQELQTRFSHLEQGLAAGKQSGLTNDESLAALQAWSWYKREPEAMLKWLLTSAQASGYNILQLAGVDPATGGVNIKAITEAIDQRLKPITDRETARIQREQLEIRTDEMLRSFQTEFPNAMVNEDLVVDIMEAQPQLTLREAWLRIENWAIRNGLDSSKNIRAQAEAVVAGNQPAPKAAPSLPRGRGGSVDPVEGPTSAYDAYKSDSIVAAAMREHGMDPTRHR